MRLAKGAGNGLVKQGLGKLSGKTYKVTQKNIDKIKTHLKANNMEAAENTAMIKRLEDALKKGERITGADASFYKHELKEAALMKGGMGYDAAHAAALKHYEVSPYSVYHPDVIKMSPTEWNDAWFKFWGISR